MVVATSGCGKKPKPVTDSVMQKPTPRAAVKLNVVVVGDEKLAAGVNLLRGEWAERSGGEISLRQMKTEEFLAADKISADLVIYPSRYVGTLVARDWVRPIRDSLLSESDFNFGDLMPLVRNRSIRYGEKYYALTLGEPPLMLACPQDSVPENGGFQWQDIQSPLHVGVFPTPSWELLVRTVSYVSLRSDSAVLFDSHTMEPRLGVPPFERALSEMLTVYRTDNSVGSQDSIRIEWPTRHSYVAYGKKPPTFDFLPMPQADEVYHASREVWETNDAEQPTTMLGFAGRSVSVLRASRNSASAFKLLLWLTSGDTAIQLSQRSEGTIWWRTSQVARAQNWLAGQNVGEGTAVAVTQTLSAENCFLLPRIPGIDEYLLTLDQEIEQATTSESTAAEVLAAVSTKWQVITEQLGVEQQRQAYRRHLGFADFAE